jgi:hypothetical protein
VTAAKSGFLPPNAEETTAETASIWLREANSGTTPPNCAWRSAWDAMTLEWTAAPCSDISTSAAAVSSQELSIPKMNIDNSLPYVL